MLLTMNKNKLILIITLSVLGVLLLSGISYAAIRYIQSNKTAKSVETSSSPVAKTETKEVPNIKHLGVNLDYYNAQTGLAGDFKFTKAPLNQNRLFMNYAHLITQTSTGSPKRNPQPTFILPIGTKVRSIVDGQVSAIDQLYSGDYSIHITSRESGQYTYELEHVSNVSVKVGDKVTAGQVVAEVSPHDSNYNDGMGLYEIGILTAGEGGRPRHICPFAYLDSSVKADLQAKINALYVSWEEYRGDSSLYNEAAMPTPGCETLEPIDE